MALETFNLEHLPTSHTLHVALFRNVTNAGFLQQQLLEGNPEFEYAFIDAEVIISRVHALAAAYRAINDLLLNRLKSRNVHSEIVFCLSPNNNIAESFRRFGISSSSSTILAMKLLTPLSSQTPTSISTHLQTSIAGTRIPFTDAALAQTTDLPRIRKIYKLNAATGGGGKKGGRPTSALEGMEPSELQVLVLGYMALRGATN